jgi:hypothetical protein
LAPSVLEALLILVEKSSVHEADAIKYIRRALIGHSQEEIAGAALYECGLRDLRDREGTRESPQRNKCRPQPLITRWSFWPAPWVGVVRSRASLD